MPSPSSPELTLKLKSALRLMRRTLVLKASNRAKDIKDSGGWSHTVTTQCSPHGGYVKHAKHLSLSMASFRANSCLDRETGTLANNRLSLDWTYVCSDKHQANMCYVYDHAFDGQPSPFFNPHRPLTPSEDDVLSRALHAYTFRFGNCGTRTRFLANYLWQHAGSIIHRIELMKFAHHDHTFLVVNRVGDDFNPSTWGEGCFVLDGWYQEGVVFPASDYHEMVEKILISARREHMLLKAMGINVPSVSYESDAIAVDGEIRPQVRPYPDCPRGFGIEGLLYLDDFRFGATYPKAKTVFWEKHKKTFQTTLAAINRGGFFSRRVPIVPVDDDEAELACSEKAIAAGEFEKDKDTFASGL